MELLFSQWFEGQALSLSQDMANFAKEAAKAAYSNWQYDVSLHQRTVTNDKYGSKTISVVPKQRPQGDNGFGYADPNTGEIGVYLVPKQSVDIEDFVQHELIHMFDPKLTNQQLRNKKWGLDKQTNLNSSDNDNDTYYTHPWEQDAFMRQSAESIIKNMKWLFNGDLKQIQASLRTIRPQEPWEQAWFKNPKMWRKYLNTIYQIAAR